MPVINPIIPNELPLGGGPCGWPINTGCCPDWDTHTPQVQLNAAYLATYVLWAMTGRRYGTCTLTVRPCGPRCRAGGGWHAYPVTADGWTSGLGGLPTPYIRDGQWFNCGCSGACACRATCEAWLPGPVATVTEVIVDGVILDPSAYRVDDADTLVRTDGDCWPDCQNLDLPATEEGTFQVTYARGTPVPPAGEIAAGALACEFAKLCAGGDCRLPQNLTSLTRNGIEITLPDPSDLLNAGLTGVHVADLWIRAVNPTRKTGRSRVWSPDMDYPRMTTS